MYKKKCGVPLTTDRIHHLNVSMECDVISVYWEENGRRKSVHNVMILVYAFCIYDLMQYFYCPGHFTPRNETRYPLYSRLDERQGRSGRVRRISPNPGFHPQTVSPLIVALPTKL